jgi:A/G-specific adenine glycosylase
MPEFDPHVVLLEWYDRHQRTLPWRTSPDPYAVLVSELMLQQTQVDRVVPYFERFIAELPSFAALARAPRADVIRLWSGLGYNRRAVHLHEAARLVVERHHGMLPADRQALEALPGIGPYTAGAVLSIAFGKNEAAPDTNVRRVIGRYALGGEALDQSVDAAVKRLVPDKRAGDWNQALMDLGSSICLGRKPRCLLCPLQPACKGAGSAGLAARKPRRASDIYAGSSRFYRGRLLSALAGLPAGTVASLDGVAATLAARGVAEPSVGWQSVGDALARDGLARIEEQPDGLAIGLAR